MAHTIIDGKAIAASVTAVIATEVAALRKQDIQPGLAVILVGEDPASQVYVNTKVKTCERLGIYSEKHILSKNSSTEDVLILVKKLNLDPKIHGILVQSPPPPQVDEEAVIAAIDPAKDVDCFHAVNVGKMLIGKTDGFFPCTPYGVMELLKQSGIDPAGKHAVVLGRSNIVGKPMAALLMQKTPGANATVTVVHSRTPDIAKFTRQADILITALGKPEFITADMVKEGAVVIDVGINRVKDVSAPRGYRLTGDVKFDEVAPKTSFITKVPGGVGPMTIAMLMRNTLKACKMKYRL
ncbi:MAG: bifunctional methylenetetrahydrofolate dehydrogenase/methenyltetrahydrofolate cyclohydrolase FolD [Victivallaceae bacterium]|nr:bifunctional methylenetetrahydrofolate dehydrogenase/methenyltetrahydrofolate cyclohydrolase FolD [Victivallaceae bacterium]MDD3703625.1 bifunctional methylenetetrahydrofolate dehydrogenase/methenyltetrahydrofolate cyclohydrolase FolD [Victivallaceae bacterium]MDD4317383.1 bifunctional methylenetetrahydrofolate dehydrogenase/methenyltetrahydrofolate cyclohydrolase FolD [Victivallaceae bacterium]MDD5663518.1 bifunctional methylenetetrahydrofolate dehydrogenase/methenyltetrahydrofolate cyclohyd